MFWRGWADGRRGGEGQVTAGSLSGREAHLDGATAPQRGIVNQPGAQRFDQAPGVVAHGAVKPDARNSPVRFGGRGRAKALSLPLSKANRHAQFQEACFSAGVTFALVGRITC